MDPFVEYTNAVALALLPIVSDFAKKLELPLPHPITSNHVQTIGFDSEYIETVRGAVVFTNGFTFSYNWGYVYSFGTPTSFNNCDSAEERTNYTGNINVSWK